MANVASVRSPVVVDFTLDTTPATTPLSVACNRDYRIVDYCVASQAADLDLTIATVTSLGVATTVGLLLNGADATFFRPTQTSNAAATGYLSATANIIRGNSLRFTCTDDADRCTGHLTILPGNRYSATTSTSAYYANNSASGAQGSNATQSI